MRLPWTRIIYPLYRKNAREGLRVKRPRRHKYTPNLSLLSRLIVGLGFRSMTNQNYFAPTVKKGVMTLVLASSSMVFWNGMRSCEAVIGMEVLLPTLPPRSQYLIPPHVVVTLRPKHSHLEAALVMGLAQRIMV